MGFIQTLFSSDTDQVINSVGNVLDKAVTNNVEKMQLDLETKKAERQFQLDMQDLTPEDRKAILGGVASARVVNEKIQESPDATKLSKNISPILALGGTVICFGLFGWLMFGAWEPKDSSKKEIVLYVLGVLSGILTQIFNYYFGSSQGSATKTEIIHSMHQNAEARK